MQWPRTAGRTASAAWTEKGAAAAASEPVGPAPEAGPRRSGPRTRASTSGSQGRAAPDGRRRPAPRAVAKGACMGSLEGCGGLATGAAGRGRNGSRCAPPGPLRRIGDRNPPPRRDAAIGDAALGLTIAQAGSGRRSSVRTSHAALVRTACAHSSAAAGAGRGPVMGTFQPWPGGAADRPPAGSCRPGGPLIRPAIISP